MGIPGKGGSLTHIHRKLYVSVLIHSVRGAARELVGFIGYQAELDVIPKSLEKRFGKKLTGDKLQQDFYQISQEKGEKVKAFTGRLGAGL